MKGRKNYFIRKSQFLEQSKIASQYPKSDTYRVQLEPFIGNCIEVVTPNYVYQSNMYCNDQVCGVLLLTDVQVVKVPAKSRNNPLPVIDHLWVVLDRDWEAPLDINNSLWLRGFVYEYISDGKKNIGLRVVSTKFIPSKI